MASPVIVRQAERDGEHADFARPVPAGAEQRERQQAQQESTDMKGWTAIRRL